MLKSFKEVQKNEAAYETRDRGIRSVPMTQIVGSVGRYLDFDDRFGIRSHVPVERLEKIKSRMRSGKVLPPVKLFQIKNEYYALDGNHRISAAKELGHDEIRAKVTEFIPSKGSLENLLYRERAHFDDQTQLPHTIELTDFGQYELLIEQISRHRDYLDGQSKGPVTLPDAARDWYKTIYRPLHAIIKKGNLIDHFPGRTLADLYTYISVHQWEKNDHDLRYGIGISQLVPKTMEAFRDKMANLKETEYPDMLREITAFVLINVSAKKEVRLVDRLFKLEEVKEVHSVHGSVDVIAKIVLKRDLVSSDAETIGDFVHNKIRQLSGVISSQTLIPGYSKQKND
ncbi:MAG: Lrp/AsnC ligand binding domain-containing protein [Desulfobacterales bacterium]|nr:Lrp/AsnC ligand binding domain-containing protein [Desulfobacterales bacterium]